MAIDRKWYKKSGLKLPSGDLFRIIAVWFDVTLTLSVVASKRNNDQTAQTACYILLSVVFFLVSTALLILKTGIICKSIQECTEDADKYWKYLVATLDSVLGMAVIVMGTAYLFGENLPSSLCSGDHCRQVKTGLLGGSLILNLFLTVVEKGFNWSGGWDKFKTVDAKHKQWSDLLGLLNTVVLFDQALTGFHITVYDINMSSENITCDSYSNGLSGAMYGLSVVVFTLILICVQRYCRTWVKRNLKDVRAEIKKGSKLSWWKQYCKCGWKCGCYWIEESCFIGVGISLVIFFICFVLADLPWPWNCKDQVNLQAGKKTRLALLIISFILVSFYLVLYFFVVFIPSAFHHTRKSVLHKSEIRSLFGARFRDMKTEVDEYCKCDRDDMKIKMQGDPKADQTTLSLPLSFQFEQDTECSLLCQMYNCSACTRQDRDDVDNHGCCRCGNSNASEPYELNIGSALFATPKKDATVLFIDKACNREEITRHLRSQDGVSNAMILCHSFSNPKQAKRTS
jgi:hypothetical protein